MEQRIAAEYALYVVATYAVSGWNGSPIRQSFDTAGCDITLTLKPSASIHPRFLENGREFKTPCAGRVIARAAIAGDAMRIFTMSRRCELTAKGPQVGHKVSHSNIKTKRRFLPNLANVTFISDALGRNVRLRVSTNALKSVDHNGGLDAYLIKAKADVLSPRALDLKRAIEKKVGKPVYEKKAG